MKRILHISKYYFPFRGGTEQIAQDCVNALIENYEQKVICFNDSSEDRIDEVDGIEIIRAGTFATISSQGLSKSIGKKLKQVIDDFNPDIIVFHYPNPFVSMYLLRYIPDSTKLVVYWHLDIVKQKLLKNLFINQNKRLIERADKLIATSPPYVEGSPYLSSAREKCVVIPNCINEKRLQLNTEVEERAKEIRDENVDKIICFAVGRHTKYKGFDYLIKSAHLLDDRFQIYIAGKGEETERLKKEAGGDKKIHFLGQISELDLKAYMSAMDIFCFPSITKNEAFGLALAEAMYFEKPVVTFSIPGSGVNYVSVNGITGIEVSNRNVVEYANAILRLGNSDNERREYGIYGKERVLKMFMYDQFQDRTIRLFGDLLHNE